MRLWLLVAWLELRAYLLRLMHVRYLVFDVVRLLSYGHTSSSATHAELESFGHLDSVRSTV